MKRVTLTWQDATAHIGWIDPTDPCIRPKTIVTSGYLVRDADDFIVVSHSHTVDADDQQVCDPLVILKSSISERDDLDDEATK